jgi:glutamate N-acetyltransferase/amino-acid N-acetyltransferase
MVAQGGQAVEFDEGEAREYLGGRQIELTVDLGAGHAEASVLTNDLTAAYVRINSAYST